MTSIADCRAELERLKAWRVDEIVRSNVTSGPNQPYAVSVLRQALLHRLIDAVEVVTDLLEQKKFIAAATMARSAIETAALLHVVAERAERCNDQQSLSEFNEFLGRALLGRTEKADEGFKPPHVLTCLQRVGKNITPEVEEIYDDLCEMVHPNWEGVALYYSIPIADPPSTKFGPSIDGRVDLAESITLATWTSCQILALAFDFLERDHKRFERLCADNET